MKKSSLLILICLIPTTGYSRSYIDYDGLSLPTTCPIIHSRFTPLEDQKKGVLVEMILDKSQRKNKYSLTHYIVGAGVPVWIDSKPAIAHNKIIIIDDSQVITSSFNFTTSAQDRNAENLVFISDEKLAKEYTENWKRREKISTPYE